MKFTLILIVLFAASACQMQSKRGSEAKGESYPGLVDPKYSIAKDRADLDEIRQNLPPEVKKQNDEKALMADLMGEVKYPPDVVREKFSTLVRKKRDLFNKDMTRAREEYSKVEKKTRDEFLKKLESDRNDFLNSKPDRDKRADFFNDQDETRRTFFAEQREKRDEYESDVRDKRKNFEDYVKEKNDEFNAELKDYSARWKEQQQLKN
jgi:hypothetical protein